MKKLMLAMSLLLVATVVSAASKEEIALSTAQSKTYPFSYNMKCDRVGCTTREGRQFTYEELVKIFDSGYDYTTRQDYVCHNALCFDQNLSPKGRDDTYLAEEDAIRGYNLRVIGVSHGRPMYNIGDCGGDKCFFDKDPDKAISLRYLMNQVPTLWKDAKNYNCDQGICVDPDTHWVVGVDEDDRLGLIQ